MISRDFRIDDQESVEKIYALYWTDKEFLEELSFNLKSSLYIGNKIKNHWSTYKFFVAVEKNEIVGIAGFTDTPDYLKQYAKANTHIELYIIAVKYKNNGIEKYLMAKMTEEAKNLGYTEILIYSPDTHKESWKFYDEFGEMVGKVIAPDGYPGQVWRISL